MFINYFFIIIYLFKAVTGTTRATRGKSGSVSEDLSVKTAYGMFINYCFIIIYLFKGVTATRATTGKSKSVDLSVSRDSSGRTASSVNGIMGICLSIINLFKGVTGAARATRGKSKNAHDLSVKTASSVNGIMGILFKLLLV